MPGDGRFQAFAKYNFENAPIGIYCVGLCRKLNKELIESDIHDFKSHAGGDTEVILLGIKADAALDLDTMTDTHDTLVKPLGLRYFVTSAQQKRLNCIQTKN